jgi:hypothetical protein
MDPVKMGTDILPPFGHQNVLLEIEDGGTNADDLVMGLQKRTNPLQIDQLFKTVLKHSCPWGTKSYS